MLSQYDDNFSFGHIDSENFRWEIIEKLKKLSLVQKCKECKFYSICDGGCRYERLLAFGEDWNKKVLETTCLISELWYNTVSDFISNLDKKSFDIINKRILNFISWRSLYELGKYNESKKFRTWGN
jgi:radical SAM protein with 4Fe4S-binding SPASM domain